MKIPKNVLNWLLEENNPSVCYRTLRELQDVPESDSHMPSIKQKISEFEPVKAILDSLNPDEYRINDPLSLLYYENTNDDDYDIIIHDASCLHKLAEFGMTRENLIIEKLADHYLSILYPETIHPGLNAINIRTFILLGFTDDPRLKKTIKLMKNSIRWDNGYLCDNKEVRLQKHITLN